MTTQMTHDHGAHEHLEHHRAEGHPGHHGAALGERNIAQGTIKSIGATSFALTTTEGELTVVTSADTNFHGLSRRQGREAGYQDPAAINTFAALKVGQRVGVIGARQDDTTLLAKRVHSFEP